MTKSQLLAKTKEELSELAKRLGLRGISTLRKKELADKVHTAQERRSLKAANSSEEIKRRAVRKRASDARRSKKKAAATPPRTVDLTAHKFDLTPAKRSTTPARPLPAKPDELPESYGTARLFLTARDPHWLYAYWDLSIAEMAAHRQKAVDGRLVLRLFEGNLSRPTQEIALQSDSRNWYIFVNKAGTTYHAEFGYWKRGGGFRVLSESHEASTPPDVFADEQVAQFVTIPVDIPLQDLYGMVREQVRGGEQLAGALQRLQTAGVDLPFQPHRPPPEVSAIQANALTHVIWENLLRRAQTGSVEISEWLRRRLSEELSSGVFSGLGFAAPSGSWQVALGQPKKGFWFAVNAELIIYGATEPNAKVTIDGKPIQLRPDGSFSFHYVFPDGQYRLPIVAVSAAGDDERAVALKFERHTQIKGEVGKVKQPAHLKAPAAA
jgi:hypothetical protein